MHQGFYKNYAAFNSCRIDRIYELNAHERHHKDIITSGILKLSLSPEFLSWGRQWKNVLHAMDAAKDYRYAVSVLTVNLLKLIKWLIFCHVK